MMLRMGRSMGFLLNAGSIFRLHHTAAQIIFLHVLHKLG
jgi:hypothetical protein